MKRFINCRTYTKNVWFIFRLIISYILIKLRPIFWLKMWKLANKICSKKYICNTPFWNYIIWSLNEYAQMDINYEKEIWNIINKLSKNLKGDKYLINIWCNIWRRAIDCSKNYKYKVIAFEPAPETFNKLRINIALSSLCDVFELYNLALWDTNTTLNFEYKEFHNGSSQIVKDKPLEWWTLIQVPVKKFDDLEISQEKIDKTRLIIMDVEWFEFNVIKWMEKSLKEFHDINIIMEIWENPNKDNTINFMKNLWYSISQIDEANYLFSK